MVHPDHFDDPKLRLNAVETGELLHPQSAHRRRMRRRREFLAPVPLPWLCHAAPLPGKALAVGIALWFRSGRTKCRRVRLSWSLLAKLGVSPYAGRRGLCALEEAKLVSVERGRGRCPMVTLLNSAAEPDGNEENPEGQ